MIKLTQDTRPDNAPPDFEKPETLGDVRAWSYSALKVYEECAYRTYISRVKGIKEVSGAAADRGTQIHQYAEDYVDGTMGEMHDSLFKFKDEFKELRELYAQAKVENEGEWGFDIDWATVGGVMKYRTDNRACSTPSAHSSDTHTYSLYKLSFGISIKVRLPRRLTPASKQWSSHQAFIDAQSR